MADTSGRSHALRDNAARQLANTTKTPPQMGTITPRWLVRFLPWVPVESGTYRINRVKEENAADVACGRADESDLPQGFVDYEEKPRERTLSMVSTVLDVHTRISDLFSSPHDQIKEQLRLTIENVKERQESELINNNGSAGAPAATRDRWRGPSRPPRSPRRCTAAPRRCRR